MNVLTKSIILLCTILVRIAAATTQTAPVIHISARVKEYRAGARGDLVVGEEDQRKLLLHWDHFPGASRFELCHMCIVRNGERITTTDGDKDGRLVEVDTCGGKPCGIIPGAPRGMNTIHIRVQTLSNVDDGNEGWSFWSKPRNFDVQEPSASVDHTEL